MKRRLSRDIAGIFGTRAVWALMGNIGGMIIARWLGPHDRGLFAVVLLLPSTTVTLIKLGVSQANVYHINRQQASVDRVASNSVLLALGSGLLAAAAVWGLRDNVLASVLSDVPPWAVALALLVVPLQLLDNYLYGVLQATGEFGVYNSRLLFSETIRLACVAVFVMGCNGGLAAAALIYVGVGVVNVSFLLLAMARTVRFSLTLDWPLLAEQLRFGVKSYAQTVVMHLLLRLDVWMVKYYLGAAEMAFYSLALHATELVLEIPQAIGLVLYPRLASLPAEEVHALTAQACRRMLAVTAPAALAMGMLGPLAVRLVYGRAYEPAGAPLPWAAVGVMAMSLFVILTRNFTSRNRQQVNSLVAVLALVTNVALNLTLIPRWGIRGAAMATAVSYSAAAAVLLALFVRTARLSVFDVLVAKAEDVRFFRDLWRRLWARLGRGG